jgi:hypothetical protein
MPPFQGKQSHARMVAVIAVILELFGSAVAAPNNFTEESGKVILPSYGCKSKDDYYRLIKLILSEDDAAALKFVTPRMLDGTCTILQPGKVFIEQTTIVEEKLQVQCVRKRGEPDCFFTWRSNIEPLK